jgi:sugar phosphate permease
MSESTFKTVVTAYQLGGITGSLLFGAAAYVFGRRVIFLVNVWET